MVTKLEHFRITPMGHTKDPDELAPTILYGESTFFPDAIIDGRECCAEISDEDDKTYIEIIDGVSDDEEISLPFPNMTYDILRGDDAESGPSKLTRVTRLSDAFTRTENPYFIPN